MKRERKVVRSELTKSDIQFILNSGWVMEEYPYTESSWIIQSDGSYHNIIVYKVKRIFIHK